MPARVGVSTPRIARGSARPPTMRSRGASCSDRLLLGHAAGGDADIAGVRPWPDLEGHALDALDALIHLLAVIGCAALDVSRAHTPADWQAQLTTTLVTFAQMVPMRFDSLQGDLPARVWTPASFRLPPSGRQPQQA